VPRHQRGVLDTSVIIDLAAIPSFELPEEASITALTVAELTAGPLSTADTIERGRRLERLQWVESTFEAIWDRPRYAATDNCGVGVIS
jgi:predicted nucleic acid-binding protein